MRINDPQRGQTYPSIAGEILNFDNASDLIVIIRHPQRTKIPILSYVCFVTDSN